MNADNAAAILIVEDEGIVAKDLQQTLAGLGYDAFAIASSAEEAVAHARRKSPDVVLMDIRIKGQLDGVQTAALLRSEFDVPVVYLTAHADDATIERAKETEPYGYLLKPVNSAELRSVIEVSLHKHAIDRRLRERERWFATTLGSIADAVMTADVNGTITFMNHAAEVLTGAQAGSAIGQPAADILGLIDRATVELDERTAPVIDGDRTLGTVMVLRDVTEQRRVQKHLEAADRLVSLGTMAAGVAHEVNNPLTIVTVNAEFLAGDFAELQTALWQMGAAAPIEPLLRRIATGVADVKAAGEQIGRITSDLQAFTRPAPTGGGLVDVARCIESAIRATAHEFDHRPPLVRQLETVPAVRADDAKLERVLVNLIANAAHAAAPGRTDSNVVTVSTRADEQDGIVIEVSDTGTGISSAVLARIFEPFFTTKDVGAGMGLGLSVCHGIIKSFGGELLVESQLGVGSRFRVFLPAA